MLNKSQITQRVLELLPPENCIDFDHACHSWWMDFRRQGGMRLTQAGFDVLTTVGEFETHCFDIPPAVPGWHLITLNRKLDCPYFIKSGKKPKLFVFGSKQAMMLALYGDLNQWLAFLDRQ
jgi:hypothetical protein